MVPRLSLATPELWHISSNTLHLPIYMVICRRTLIPIFDNKTLTTAIADDPDPVANIS